MGNERAIKKQAKGRRRVARRLHVSETRCTLCVVVGWPGTSPTAEMQKVGIHDLTNSQSKLFSEIGRVPLHATSLWEVAGDIDHTSQITAAANVGCPTVVGP